MAPLRKLTDYRFEHILGVFALLAILVYPLVNLVLEVSGLMTGPRLNDFGAYYQAGLRILEGYPLYAKSAGYPELAVYPFPNMGYLYHPIISLGFIPFSLLPFTIAGFLWNVVCLTILWRAVISLLRALEVNLTRVREALVLWILVGFAPTITWLKLGQISGFLAALLCFSGASVISQQKLPPEERSSFSGAYIVVAGLIKPFYLPAGAYLLLDRRRIISAFFTFLTLIIAGIAIFGIHTNVEYIEVLMRGKGWSPGGSWNATNFRPLVALGWMALPVKILVTISMVGTTIFARTRLRIGRAVSTVTTRRGEQLLFGLSTAIIPIVTPSSNVLALNALIPAFVIILVSEVRRPDGWLAIPFLALLLVQIHPYTIELIAKFGPQYIPEISVLRPYLPWIQPAVWGVLLLVGLIAFRLFDDLRTTASP